MQESARMSSLRLATPAFLCNELERALPARPFELEFWDGTRLPATTPGGPAFRLRGPGAVSHLLRSPGQLGIGRAYVSGLIEVDDLDRAMELVANWKPPKIDRRTRLRLALAAVPAAGLTLPPPVPEVELRPRGERHSRERDRRAIRHHYDVSNEFFALFLDDSLTYSCALFSRGARTLEEAQQAKLELICQKLGLQPGERVLDVGCGWGSFAIHAAARHGVRVLGITLSEPQARLARERVADAGLDANVEVRVADYRDLAGERFDSIASIGMVEHVGAVQIDDYSARLAELLRPGGRLLNHGIARLRHGDPEAGPFSERYVFPDAAPLHLARVLLSLERAHLVTAHVEGLAGDYIVTLDHWIARLDANLERAAELVGAERLRVWRLYLRAARNGFRVGFTGVYQVVARRPAAGAEPSF
jgi:cyclopropane-fatty-acyl-phospholipid synthase